MKVAPKKTSAPFDIFDVLEFRLSRIFERDREFQTDQDANCLTYRGKLDYGAITEALQNSFATVLTCPNHCNHPNVDRISTEAIVPLLVGLVQFHILQ